MLFAQKHSFIVSLLCQGLFQIERKLYYQHFEEQFIIYVVRSGSFSKYEFLAK